MSLRNWLRRLLGRPLERVPASDPPTARERAERLVQEARNRTVDERTADLPEASKFFELPGPERKSTLLALLSYDATHSQLQQSKTGERFQLLEETLADLYHYGSLNCDWTFAEYLRIADLTCKIRKWPWNAAKYARLRHNVLESLSAGGGARERIVAFATAALADTDPHPGEEMEKIRERLKTLMELETVETGLGAEGATREGSTREAD